MSLILFVSVLIAVVLACNVIAHHRLSIKLPSEYLTEFREVLSAKHVFVVHDTPYAKSLRIPLFYTANLIPRNRVFDSRAYHVLLVRANRSGIGSFFFGERKLEFFRNWYWENGRCFFEGNFSCGCITGVSNEWFSFKPEVIKVLSVLLVNGTADDYSQISAQCRLVSEVNYLDYIFHRISRSSRFPNMPIHRFALLDSALNGLAQFYGLVDINQQLQERDERKRCCQVNDMPIIRRFIVAILSLTCGFFGSLYGWGYLNHKRRLIGAAMIAANLFVACAGLTLFWLTNFTWSWCWPL